MQLSHIVRTTCVGLVIAGLLAVAFWYTGRAPMLDHAAVRSSTDEVASLRAEGRHLVRLVRAGDDLPRTTTVRANELAEELDAIAGDLGSAQVARADRADATRAVRAAERAARRLRALAAHPTRAGTEP